MFDDGVCTVTTHTCDGISDLGVLKRKIKTTNHITTVDEPLYSIPQVRAAGKRENKKDILDYLSKKSKDGPVTQIPDNIDAILGFKSSTYQSIRRAQD